MSVIDLDLWVSFQVLKSTHQQLQIYVAKKLRQVNKQFNNYHSQIVAKLFHEIQRRDQLILQLKRRNKELENANCSNNLVSFDFNQNDKQSASACVRQYNKEQQLKLKQLNQKYKQALELNKMYEQEFVTLIQQIKIIKFYLEQTKKLKSTSISQNQQSLSPANKLTNQQQQFILSKINNLNRFNYVRKSGLLDTIREVTQLSVHSGQQNAQLNDIDDTNQAFANLPYTNPNIQSQSFQCINEILDIANILCQGSRELPKNKSQAHQSFEQSLCVLKNYCSKSNVASVDQQINDQKCKINLGCQLRFPFLRLKGAINQKYLIYQNGYAYTGNTIRLFQSLTPHGFGQLYLHNQLIYCGMWINGIFDGWGKMFFDNTNRIKNYNGKWFKGHAHGTGSIKFWNNDKFIGIFKNGKITGQGRFEKDDQIIHGIWQNNILISRQD